MIIVFSPRAICDPSLVIIRALLHVLIVDLVNESLLVLTLQSAPHFFMLASLVFGSGLWQLHILISLTRRFANDQ